MKELEAFETYVVSTFINDKHSNNSSDNNNNNRP